jgi:hypothetical protein
MRDVYRAASDGFSIFGGATEFGATGRRPPTTAIGNIILSGSTSRTNGVAETDRTSRARHVGRPFQTFDPALTGTVAVQPATPSLLRARGRGTRTETIRHMMDWTD